MLIKPAINNKRLFPIFLKHMLSIMVKVIIILQYWGLQKSPDIFKKKKKSPDMKNDNLDVYRGYHLFKSQFKFIKSGFPFFFSIQSGRGGKRKERIAINKQVKHI
jgi:hypothetical protein